MGQLDVHIRHGGGGGDIFAMLAPVAVVGFIGYAAVELAAKTVAAIPVWVFVMAPVVAVAVAVWVTRTLMRHNRREAAEFTARCAERRAIEAAEKEERRRHRLELAAASAPVIQNHVWTLEAIEAMRRGYAPATIITDAKEIQR